VVNLLLEDGVTVNFQMSGFTNVQTRRIRIMGTRGEVWGDFRAKEFFWQLFGEKEVHRVDTSLLSSDLSGHGGGDYGLIRDAIRYFRGDGDLDVSCFTGIDRSVESHFVCFAAEESRLMGGKTIEMDDFIQSI